MADDKIKIQIIKKLEFWVKIKLKLRVNEQFYDGMKKNQYYIFIMGNVHFGRSL